VRGTVEPSFQHPLGASAFIRLALDRCLQLQQVALQGRSDTSVSYFVHNDAYLLNTSDCLYVCAHRVLASQLVLQFEGGRPMSEIPRWWQQPHRPETRRDRQSIDQSVAVIRACFGWQGFPSAQHVARPWKPAGESGPLTPWQCAACERTLQCCKEAESAVQRTITLVQDRRVGAGCSSEGGVAPSLSNKRGTDRGSEDKSAGEAKRHAGGTTPDTPQPGSGAREEEQRDVQEVQDLVDRWLETSLLDEATSDRLLAALYRYDAALLRAWRCNKQHPDPTLLRRLLLAIPAK
jgi:hypothetical protein